MPIINLPQDTRWGDTGKGIGQLVGALIGGYAESQVQKGVGALIQDPNIAEAKLPGEVFKQYGNKGIEILAKLNALKEQQATITQKLAGAGLTAVQTAIANAKAGVAAPMAAAELATEQAKPAHVAAQTENLAASSTATRELLNPRVEALQADTAEKKALTQPTVALRTEQASKAAQDAEQTFLENQALRAKGAGGVPNFDTMLAPYKLNPEEAKTWRDTLVETYRGAKTGQEMTAVRAQLGALATGRQREAKTEEVHPLETDSAKIARTAAEHGAGTERFMNVLRKEPENFGLLSGAGLKARMERIGLPINEPGLIEALEEQKLLAANQAKAGAVFMSAQTIALGKDISPNVDRSPLSNWKAIDAVATQQLAGLNSEIARYEGVTPKRQVKPLLEAKTKWEGIQALASSIKTNVSADGNRTVMYFDGKQVDPLSFKVLIDPSTTYDLGGGQKATGFELKQQADAAKTDPFTALKQYRTRFGYKGK